VALAGTAADPWLRRLAAGLPRRRWSAPSDARRGVLGVATGVIGAALALAADPAALAVPALVLAPILVVATAVDLRWHRLPDRLTLPGALAVAVAVVLAAWLDGDASLARDAVAGAAVVAGVLLLVHIVSPAGMGFGDVKFGLPLGLALGATAVTSAVVALLVAMVAGAVAGLALLVRHRDRRRPFPFGPCLALGTVVALLLH